MTSLGKQVRLNRLLNKESHKLLAITLDHAIARGVLPGLEDVAGGLQAVMQGKPDAVTLHKGIAEQCFSPYAGQVGLIIKCSSFSPFHKSFDALVTQVDEAVRIGADGAAIGLIVGDSRQPEALSVVGKFVREAELAGLPVIGHIYPRGDLISESERATVENVSYAARVGAELGIAIIKTTYTGSTESFARVVEACPALVVAAGGIDSRTVQEYLQKTRDVMDSGALGVAYGRFVWGYKDPPSLIRGLKAIIHEGRSVDEALEIIGDPQGNRTGL